MWAIADPCEQVRREIQGSTLELGKSIAFAVCNRLFQLSRGFENKKLKYSVKGKFI